MFSAWLPCDVISHNNQGWDSQHWAMGTQPNHFLTGYCQRIHGIVWIREKWNQYLLSPHTYIHTNIHTLDLPTFILVPTILSFQTAHIDNKMLVLHYNDNKVNLEWFVKRVQQFSMTLKVAVTKIRHISITHKHSLLYRRHEQGPTIT